MSVTNGERLVTKQDLADMYQGILPYLGGMPEMVANKFSKGDLYSTDEKMIGQWIDGKPLYQRTVVIDNPLNNWDTIQSYGIENIEHVISINDRYWMDNNAWEGSQYYKTTDNITAIFLRPGFRLSCVGATPSKVILTIQYTKTTDSAISIGSDTDYSTEEKIVGTWIDGSPIYQRTYNIGTLKLGTTWSSPTLDFTIDRIINAIGCGEGLEGGTSKNAGAVVFPVHAVGGFTYDLSVKTNIAKNSFVVYSSAGKITQILNTYLTVQYTKTT